MPCLLGIVLMGGWGTQAHAEDSLGTRQATNSHEIELRHEKASQDLRSRLQSIWAGATLREGITAVYVVDAESGETLYNVHDSDALNPASNVKLISTGTVLATLGPDWRFQTQLLGAVPDAQGVVQGGVYLYGNHDPTLGPLALGELAATLRAQGVTRIVGDVFLSDSLTRETLAMANVRVTVTGAAPGRAASVETWPATDFVQITSNRTRSKHQGRSKVRVTTTLQELPGQQPTLQLALRGTIRRGITRILHIPVQRRSTFTASALKRALQDAGISVDGSTRIATYSEFSEQEGSLGLLSSSLAAYGSQDIATLIKRVNKRSLNYLSDRLVMSAAREVYGGHLDMERAVDLMKGWLTTIGVDATSVVLDTGSGLSYQTKLSARQIVTVLRAAGGYLPMPTPPNGASTASFRESLALGGIDGTLRSRFRQRGATVTNQVFGKTGTLTSVIALSGFITHPDGRTLCFSIVTNGHQNHRKRLVRLEHEHMIAKLDQYLGKL